MAKVDKDALKKNAFWIGTGAFALLWLAGLSVALFSSKAAAAKKAYDDSKSKITSAGGDVKSEAPEERNKFLAPWKKHKDKFSAHKNKIWEKAWVAQAYMWTWPNDMIKTIGNRSYYVQLQKDGKFSATRPLPPLPDGASDGEKAARTAYESDRAIEDANVRNAYASSYYAKQFVGLESLVYPAEFEGGFANVFPKQGWDVKSSEAPLREEIVLAQEDYVVRREMLYIVKAAIDTVQTFTEVTDAVVGPAKDKAPRERRVFRNANWELDLVFEPGDPKLAGSTWVIGHKSRIKNINKNEKTLSLVNPRTDKGLPFLLWQEDGAHFEWRIAGSPVAPGESAPVIAANLPPVKVSPVNLKKEINVAQQLYWEISPVRRVDVLAVSKHSHRTAPAGLKANDELKKIADPEEKAPEEAEGATGGSQTGGPPAGMTAPPPMGSGEKAGPGAGAAAGDVTRVNKIPRARYMHLTPTVRHLPIAMRLVVDQAHLHDVLAAVTNSRMRIQITQVSVHNAGPLTRSDAKAPDGEKGGGKGPGLSPGFEGPRGGMPPVAGMTPGSAGPRMPPGPRGGMGMPNMPGALAPGGFQPGDAYAPKGNIAAGGAEESVSPFRDTARLVEMSIYGIASLYEPYDPNASTTTPEKK